MNQMPRYSVIDIETTGGKAGVGRITEIAIFVMEGPEIVDEFVSLVNPECNIPPYISRLTGITNEMVAEAPRFYEIARQIVEITEQTIFVAHNAPFDYNFLKKEFESLGYNYIREVLCTIRLSRKIIPGYSSYSLGKLCQDLGIPLSGRHRAGGDAHATALLLKYLIEKNEGFLFPENDFDTNGLNPALDLRKIRDLPEMTGVYYFHDEKKDVIYIGKSTNIRKRVFSHLSAKGKRSLRMKENITDVSFEPTGSELIALLKEVDEIKEYKPLFNRSGRKTCFNWGLFSFYDRVGYQRIFVDRINDNVRQPIDAYTTQENAKNTLSHLVEEFEICRQLSGLEEKKGPCFNHSINQCKGACVGIESPKEYNLRVQKVIDKLNFSSSNFVVFDKGREGGETAFVWIENNVLKGYGWLNKDDTITNPLQLADYIDGGNDNRDTRQIVRTWLRSKAASNVKILKYDSSSVNM